ncbi:MAG: hypothetical protein CR974_01945, partial [Gammaproteobacteria bacterium]
METSLWSTNYIEYEIQQIKSGKRDRQHVLSELLIAIHGGENREITNNYIKLFAALEPQADELLNRQDALFSALTCPQSKVQNDVLTHLKAICTHEHFDWRNFVAHCSAVLSVETKSVVTKTVMIFEQLAKLQKDAQPLLCESITQGLISTDEKIQMRVAKFLVKYASSDDNISAEIATYYPHLFSSVKDLLRPLCRDLINDADVIADVPNEVPQQITYLHDDRRIEIPETFDDQILFIAQVFENNAPYHFDIYATTLIKLIPQINEDNIERLAPLMKNALRGLNLNGSFRHLHNMERLMARHFFHLIQALLERTPNKKFQRKYETVLRNIAKDNREILPITHHKYHIVANVFLYAQQLGMESRDLPLLSTPTHEPCFIAFETFYQRLLAYQAQGVAVNEMDFQLAVARVVIDKTVKTEALTGEYGDVVRYLQGEIALDFALCETLPLWLMSVYRKGDKTELTRFVEHFQVATHLLASPQWKVTPNEDVALPFIINGVDVVTTETYGNYCGRYSYLWKMSSDTTIEERPYLMTEEAHKSFSLQPFNPDLMVAEILNNCDYNYFASIAEPTNQVITQFFTDAWQKNYGVFCYVFLAKLCFSEKKYAQLGAGLWEKCV